MLDLVTIKNHTLCLETNTTRRKMSECLPQSEAEQPMAQIFMKAVISLL